MVIPISGPSVSFDRDDKGRVILGTNLCGGEYGSDLGIISMIREYPVNKPLFPNYTFVPLAFVRNNFHFIDYDVVEFNTYFVKSFFISFIDLHAILLSRGGPYGFCTWKQLQYHAMNPQARYIRDNGLLEWPGDFSSFDKTKLEGPVFGSSLVTDSLLAKLDNSSKEVVFDDIFSYGTSLANDYIMFNSDDIVLKNKEINLKSDNFEYLKYGFLSSDGGKFIVNKTNYTTILRQGNPEKIVSEKNIENKIRLGNDGVVVRFSHAEVVFPDRFNMFRKFVRVRTKFLDWKKYNSIDRSFDDYIFTWVGNYTDMVRNGVISTSQVEDSTGLIVPRGRWPFNSYYYGGEKLTPALRYNYEEHGEYLFYKVFNSSNSIAPSPRYCATNLNYYTPSTLVHFIYRINKQTGFSPTYDSYEEYLHDIKIKSQGYSFVKERDLMVYGTDDAIEQDNYNSIGFFAVKKIEPHISNLMEEKSLVVSLSVLKKFWPKRGFFPADRILQIAKLLKESYDSCLCGIEFSPSLNIKKYKYLPNSNNIWQSFLECVISPGVFLNSVKSGVAVGFPMYRLKKDVNNNYKFYDLHYFSDGAVSYNLFLGTVPDFYLPFESLFDLSSYLRVANSSFSGAYSYSDTIPIYQTPLSAQCVHGTNDGLSVSHSFCLDDSAKGPSLFEKANHNFFSEVVNFFLKDGETTCFESKRESEFLSAEAGVVYYMDVVLKKKDIILSEGRSSSGSLPERNKGMAYGVPLNPLYGLEYEVKGISDAKKMVSDPAYAPFTPPYFYGDAVARLSFDPLEADPNLKVGETKKFSLEDILANVKSRMVRFSSKIAKKLDGSNSIFIGGYNEEIGDLDGIFNTINWLTYYNETDFPDVYDNLVKDTTDSKFAPLFVSGCMDITQSVFLFKKKRNFDKTWSETSIVKFNERLSENKDNDYSWVIEMKFETPVLDFSMHDNEHLDSMPQDVGDGTYLYKEHGERSRGVWFDYGVEPKSDAGLFLELRESFADRYEDGMNILNVNSNWFDKLFSEEPALFLFWKKDFYSFSLDPPGTIFPVYLVSNFDTDVVFSYFSSCSGPGAPFTEHSVTFVDTSWLSGRSIKKGYVYEIQMKSLAPNECPVTLEDAMTIIRANSGDIYSRDCYFKLVKTPEEGCELYSVNPASSYFSLSNLVQNSTEVYSSLLTYYTKKSSSTNKRFGSLIKLCGFNTGRKKIGVVKDYLDLKEGIVVVPYVVRNGEKQYFEIDSNMLLQQTENYFNYGYSYKTIFGDIIQKTSIIQLYESVRDFWFPEKFDFVYKGAKPYIMFFFDVSLRLTKQDLLDLWQNIIPMSIRKVLEEKLEKEYFYEEYEILGKTKFPHDVCFEVFSVPKRGLQNYGSVLRSEYEKDRDTDIVYNWPYSYFRISEYARVAIEKRYELK